MHQFIRYQAQVTLLTSLLRPLHGPQLEIGTVDGMQGREKDAIIISLVRSNESVSTFVPKSNRGPHALIERSRIPQRKAQVEWQVPRVPCVDSAFD